MAYYNGKKVLSVVQVKEVEVDYYVGVATLESEKQDEIVIPSYLQVNNTNFPILENTKTAIVEIGGNSQSFNQLVKTRATATLNGITFTNNGDGSYTLNGTASAETYFGIGDPFNLVSGHKYLLKGCPVGGAYEKYMLTDSYNGFMSDYGSGIIKTATASQQYQTAIRVRNGQTLSNIKFIPQLFDLTLMGLDSITSVAEFKALFPLDYYEYQENNIKSTILSKIESFDTNNTKLGQINLPNGTITLNGVNDIHDLLTFEEQENGTYNAILTRKIGVVDLSSLSWSYNSQYNDHCYIAYLESAFNSENVVANILCKKYRTIKNSDQLNASNGISNLQKYIRISDSNFVNDLSNFVSSLSGVMFYYELATPTTEVIATGLTFDQVSTLFEKGGTIQLDNSNTDYIQANLSMAFAIRRFRSVED